VLTTALIRWFWDHYADPAQRRDPRVAPLYAQDLSNLPPALVVTCEFDPLRDDGALYADAMRAAGVAVRHLDCRGQIHTSLHAVDLIASSASARQEMALALREFSRVHVPA
jgi:acetyl esterase/lipase